MAPPAAPQQPNPNDSGLGPLWIIILVFLVALLIWYIAGQHIVWAVLKIRMGEMWLISHFTSSINVFYDAIGQLILSPKHVTFTQLVLISTVVGEYFAIPAAVLLGLMAIILYFSSVTIQFKTTYNMKTLMAVEKENWPQVIPVSKLNLLKQSINEGPWAMTIPPLVFAKKYNLIREETLPLMEDELSKEVRVIAVLKRQAATRIFAMQLGELWQGPERLPIYVRALFAIFAARTSHDTDAASNLLHQIAASAESGRLDFTGADALLRKYRNTKAVKVLEKQHAYVFTLMASLLQAARTDGVLASAEFIWLKPIDRRLWYTLNTVGRQTAPTEVAGIYAHWITEKEIGRRLVVPMVEEATNALEQALQEIVYKPKEEEEGAKKSKFSLKGAKAGSKVT